MRGRWQPGCVIVQSIFNSLTRPDSSPRCSGGCAERQWQSCVSGRHRGAFPTHRNTSQVESSVCCKEARTSQGRPTKGYWWAHASRAITTPHHLTTVQLTRVPGGGRFYAVCCRILLPAAASSLPDSLPRTPHAAQPLHVQPAVKARHESDELA